MFRLPFEMFKKYHDLKEKALEYKNNGNFKKSSKCLEKILDDWPDNEDIIFLLAENYCFLDDYDSALREYERLVEINPGYVGVYSRIAKICIGKEEIEKAREYLQKEHKAEDDLLIFKINNDLNLKLVEYNQELADLNERVKVYLEKNFNYSF